MTATKGRIQGNLDRIHENIAEAASRSGRRAGDVRIVAVTKAVDLEAIKNLLACGQFDLAESHVQQLTDRAAEVSAYIQRRRTDLPDKVRWHLVGHLQRNKVKAVLGVCDVIHSVDSLRLAEEINNRAEQAGRVVDVLLQVNCSMESQKFGCAVGAALHLGELLSTLKNLRLTGLMTMAPLSGAPDEARPSFVRLRELFDEMRGHGIGGPAFRELSMGMSQDYVAAVEEGATLLRIGTALFE